MIVKVDYIRNSVILREVQLANFHAGRVRANSQATRICDITSRAQEDEDQVRICDK